MHDVAELRRAPGAWTRHAAAGRHQRPAPFRLLHGRGEAGFDEADVVVEGEWECAGAAARAARAARRAGRVERRAADAVDGHADAVQRAPRAGLHVRPAPRPTCASSRRRWAARSAPRRSRASRRSPPRSRARPAGRCKHRARRATEVFVDAQPPSGALPRAPRRARATARFVARRVWAAAGTRARMPTPARTSPPKGGWAAVGPYRFDHVEVDSRLRLHEPPPQRRLPRLRGDAGGLGLGAVRRPARRPRSEPTRSSCGCSNVLRDGDRFATGEVHARLPRRGVPRGGAPSAIGWAADRRGVGLCALMKGMQTPSRAGAAHRARGRAAHRVRGHGRDRPGARRPCCRCSRPRRSASSPRSSASSAIDTDVTPFDTRTTSSRSTHMMAAALAEAARELRRAVADELEVAPGDLRFTADGGVEVVGTPGLAPRARRPPDRSRGGRARDRRRPRSRHGTGHRLGPLAPGRGRRAGSRVDEETGVVEIVDLAASVYAGRVVDGSRAALQNDGSVVMGIGSRALRVDRVRRRPGHERQPRRLPAARIPRHPGVLGRAARGAPGGEIHGLGETALPLVPPALGNALHSLGLASDAHARARPSACSTAIDTARRMTIRVTLNGEPARARGARRRDAARRAAPRRACTPCGSRAASACAAPARACSTASPSRRCLLLAPLADGAAIDDGRGPRRATPCSARSTSSARSSAATARRR